MVFKWKKFFFQEKNLAIRTFFVCKFDIWKTRSAKTIFLSVIPPKFLCVFQVGDCDATRTPTVTVRLHRRPNCRRERSAVIRWFVSRRPHLQSMYLQACFRHIFCRAQRKVFLIICCFFFFVQSLNFPKSLGFLNFNIFLRVRVKLSLGWSNTLESGAVIIE